ncbi:hypothetical protein N0V93_010028 [Gnomoniopsis smithogilvyi]|uniref:Uncharacterized protein n=1 Tax=Gnomoniopsis smithogilvyi TaxID=1191159 RepID=A0A9W9CS19_9PEZI|nr:hypothetical protein N0V93_010028 [Gnomoniopsis smithogilvyi]
METSVESEFGGATVLSTLSNSRMNVLANQVPPARRDNDENANHGPISDMISPAEQVSDFFVRRPRTVNDIVRAILRGSYDFVTAMLDVSEISLNLLGGASWNSTLTKLLVCDFGWIITEVVDRDYDGDPRLVVIARPSRAVEERARARSKARRARGIEPPMPRTYYEQQVNYFLSRAGLDDILYELRTAPSVVVDVILEHLKRIAKSELLPYWHPLIRMLLDKFDWNMVGGSVYADIKVAPPSIPNRRRRDERRPPAFREARQALRATVVQ